VHFQLVVLFGLAYNVMRCHRVAQKALWVFALSCALLAILHLLGLTPVKETLNEDGRFSAFGLDPNQSAQMLSLGVLVLLGLPRAGHGIFVRLRALVWPLILIVGLAIAATGSRGGLLALGAGLLTLIWGRGSFTAKVRNTLLVSLIIAFVAFVALRSDTVTARFEKAVHGGDLCHREAIYPTALQLFFEKPLLGWGPVANKYELGARLRLPGDHKGRRYVDAGGAPRIDTHNLVLYVLTATGLLGSLPFLAGTWLCILAAWKARSGVHGILPLAMVVSVLVADMSVSGLHWKHHWLVMAYGLACAGPGRGRAARGRSPGVKRGNGA